MTTRWNRIAERPVADVMILDVSARSCTVSDESGELFRRIQQILAQGWLKILLNLHRVEILDANGLGEIVRGYKAARDSGGVLRLCAGQRIRRLLVATGLEQHIELFSFEAAALNSFISNAV